MNKAKEEALKMLKNNNAAKAAEILKKNSTEASGLVAKNKPSILEALDIRPLFSTDAEKEATAPVEKLVATILSLGCGTKAAYLICGFFQESNNVFMSDRLAFLFSFGHPFIWIVACFGFGFVFNLEIKSIHHSPFSGTDVATKDSNERMADMNRQMVSSPAYSYLPGNIYHSSRG